MSTSTSTSTSSPTPSSRNAEDPQIATRLFADGLAASLAGFAVAPIVSAVDKALAQNSSGTAPLWTSFGSSIKELVKSPVQFLKSPSFRWIWLVYSSTYFAANAMGTASAATKTDGKFATWAATSTVNTTTSILKDRAFARLFGKTNVAPTPTPMGSYAAWLTRDLVSMAVFFNLPPIVGDRIGKYTGNPKTGYYAAQFGLPLALQFVTTPIHLLGFDIHNNPKATVSERIAFLQKDYFKSVGIRMVRMVAPWSVGTIGNKELRGALAEKFVRK